MLQWGFIILGLFVAIAMTAIILRGRRAEQRAVAERRKRFTLPETGERVPLAAEKPVAIHQAPDDGPGLPLKQIPRGLPAEPAQREVVSGRLVQTPDGEMILTSPPFALRAALFTNRTGRFVNALTRRAPAWIIVCPKVRLDSLVTPTKPDGRDPEDWRDWRRRVRMRSVDLVLCDRRSWKPLLAVVFEQRPRAEARTIAGGQDRMIDEVLHGAGLPMLRLSGDFEKDWPLIRPYVDESILPHTSEEQVLEATDRTSRVDTDSAVTLLRMDQEKGWMLE